MGASQEIHTDSIIFHHSVDHRKTDEYALHCHNFYEIYYFIAGNVSYLVEGKPYVPAPHSILLISPNVFHGVKVENDQAYERFALHFVPSFLSMESRSLLLSPFHPAAASSDIYFPNADAFHMQDYFEQLLDSRNMSTEMQQISIKIRLEALLTQLLFMRRSTNEELPDGRSSSRTAAQVIDYLNEHLTEDLTLDELSSRFYISKHHLNKVFRKATGTTVGNYVIYKRVVLAQQLIMQGQSAGSASASAGFQDYSTFFRAYKKVFGHAPTDNKSSILLR
jgi:AraC-like DNA-binding protein